MVLHRGSRAACDYRLQQRHRVAVGRGEDVVCTITNNDEPGTIIVKKVIKPKAADELRLRRRRRTGYVDFNARGRTQNSQTP